MKKQVLLGIIVMAFALCVNSNAWAVSGWADSVISSNQMGAGFFPSDPTKTLGESDFPDTSIDKNLTYYNLGLGGDAGGFLEVGFSNPIILGTGDDVEVYGIGWIEPMKLRLPDLSEYTYTSFFSSKGWRDTNERLTIYKFDIGGTGDPNIGSLTLFGGYQYESIPFNGSDIDAIKGLTVTPEPLATVLFLVGGIPIGINIFRRRRLKV